MRGWREGVGLEGAEEGRKGEVGLERGGGVGGCRVGGGKGVYN